MLSDSSFAANKKVKQQKEKLDLKLEKSKIS